MADKKGNCGCGCIGKKQDSSKDTSDKKKPKKSKQGVENLAVENEAGEITANPCLISDAVELNYFFTAFLRGC